ncbi:unnamed protein product [Parascedosporium putredinis]|uniref:Histone H4 n=1 Tax=Parascedosporium putredinis TaxID=1442378 RepID=A0A9P1GVG1_9PEZI|nr:unnamed protein product [Parascedosporium putredinis]CAI7987800.1 unnamed protein product [Parascedosporium putredinis]
MFNWAKQQLANVAGTQEPIYGPTAIKSVAEEAATVPGLHTTCQFTAKVFPLDSDKTPLWSSTQLSNPEFSEDKTCFYADNCAIELSEDGTAYTVKSLADEACIVNMTITRKTPAIHAGTTGTTLFGTDLTNPWGSVRHAFWPRCTSEGTITTPDGAIDFTGRAFFGPTHSAILMEFTTPPSYGSTSVCIGIIAKENEILSVSCDSTVTHIQTAGDPATDWPAPSEAKYTWAGKTKDGAEVTGVIEGVLGQRLDRIDVMAEVPGFVKKIVQTAAGTKPYVYQYSPKDSLDLKFKIGDTEVSESGALFVEATFISEKVIKDAIKGVTRPAIRRLARRGGVKRISAAIYDEVRFALDIRLRAIIKDCVHVLEYRGRKTVTVADVIFSLRRMGRPIYGFDPDTYIPPKSRPQVPASPRGA